jgi:hypothetical protein
MRKLFIVFFLIVLCSAMVLGESPIPNAGFEAGNLSGWKTYCVPNSRYCGGPWSVTVDSSYAYSGDYGALLSNHNTVHWSGVILRPLEFFIDDSEVYTIPMKLVGGRQRYSGVLILIQDKAGWVRYRGNSYGSIHGAPPDIYFRMDQGVWKEYSFNFAQDYRNKYGRDPGNERNMYIYAYEDDDFCDLYVDNVFGEKEPPCTDNDYDDYAIEGGDCGHIDCDDNDVMQYPGTIKVTHENEPWGDTGECQKELSQCDGELGEFVVVQYLVGPADETCDNKDNDCSGAVDDIDEDGDIVNDCYNDVCPGSTGDGIDLNPNHYAQNVLYGLFEVGPGNNPSLVYSMKNTRGCTCLQIVNLLEAGEGHAKHGCSPSIMEEWTGISANPDRVYNKKGGNKGGKLSGRAVSDLSSEDSELLMLYLLAMLSVVIVTAVALRFIAK